jgi:uncharacterized protein YuzE
MKIEYDPKYDIMNIEFIAEGNIAESVELEDGIIVDYTDDKKVVSIEILDVKKRVSGGKLESVNFVILE